MSRAPAMLLAGLALLLAGRPAAATSAPCQRQPILKQWLQQQLPAWQAQLAREPGYHAPAGFTVCLLQDRRPYADVRDRRIYVDTLRSSNDAASLVHEYLHLALAGHPHGRDERYVEALARRLLRTGGN
jgi:uncharacterized protein YfaQ (DUF2300 family)